MGGVGFSIEIHTNKKKPYMTPKQLHSWVWRKIYDNIYEIANRGASRKILSYYLRDEASDGLDGKWECTQNRLSFSFMEAAGCCNMSSQVSHHWATISYKFLYPSLSKDTPNFDWDISDLPGTIDDLLFNHYYPIIELSGKLFCVAINNDAQEKIELFTDGGETLALSTFSSSQKKRILSLLESKLCHCQLCKFYLPIYQKVKSSEKQKLKLPFLS
jgi:hypothetical protein